MYGDGPAGPLTKFIETSMDTIPERTTPALLEHLLMQREVQDECMPTVDFAVLNGGILIELPGPTGYHIPCTGAYEQLLCEFAVRFLPRLVKMNAIWRHICTSRPDGAQFWDRMFRFVAQPKAQYMKGLGPKIRPLKVQKRRSI